MKKLFAVLLALTLVLSMGTMALAADTGTITIDNAFNGATYNIYKILDFVPVAGSTTQGRYTVVEDWADFLADEGAAYLKVNDETGTIEWNGEETAERKAELAKAAVAYAKKEGIAATATQTVGKADPEYNPEKTNTVTFSDLALGYYAIDTSLGTMCALTRATSEFNAYEKNEKPDIDKFVQEDSEMNNADGGWGKVNDADIDQVVNYKSTITVGLGATNYVMHDTMEAGLTFDADSVVVKLANGTEVDADNYTVVYPATDGHTFDVVFDNDFIAGLAQGTKFTVYYSATLNENANIVVDGNDNTVYLSYGEDSTWETNEHKTTTYTWKMDVLKFTETDENPEFPLAGAKFQLLDKDGNAIKFSKNGNTYKVDAEGTVTEIETDATGMFEIIGLDEGQYALRETKAPEGYNELADDIDVIITSTYDEAALTATYEINEEDPATIKVENKTGSLLPETGGIGTTIFYVVGGLLMAAAFILLVSKKRMATFA